jgi:hypothetical protein
METGTIRDIVRAYRRARGIRETESSPRSTRRVRRRRRWAGRTARCRPPYGAPRLGKGDSHREWFNRCEAPAWPVPARRLPLRPAARRKSMKVRPLRGIQRPSRQSPGCPEHLAPSEPCIFAC